MLLKFYHFSSSILEYFAQPLLDFDDETSQEVRTYAYSAKDSGTCEVPKLPGPEFTGVKKGKLFVGGGNLFLFGEYT